MEAGTHRRIYILCEYFKRRGFNLDLLTLNGFTNRWDTEELERRDLFDTIKAPEWRPSFLERYHQRRSIRSGRLTDRVISGLRKEFRRMFLRKKYDFVVITYAYWASLVEGLASSTVKIMNMQDFLTLQSYLRRGRGEFTLGRMFEDEVKAVSMFDYVLSISDEESMIFSPFCPDTEFIRAPVSFPCRFGNADRDYDYDVFFIGSDNPYNHEGVLWFMNNVYPLLPRTIKIAIAGKVSSFVEKKDNITLIPYVDDLDKLHRRSRLHICPLKGGTGLKIKIVEALSYGIPIVTTSWGLTGILQKYDNGCVVVDGEEEFAEAIKKLLNDRNEYIKLKKQGEDFFRRNFSTDAVDRNLDYIFLRDAPRKDAGG